MTYARAWRRWFPLIEAGASTLNERMLRLGELERAKTVLDIGTGIGEPALSAARRVAPGGRIVAIDNDPLMIEFARARAAEQAIGNVDFEVSDIAEFDCGRLRFDTIFARWSLMFTPDIETLLPRLAAALRAQGGLVAAIWDRPDRVPAITLARDAARACLGLKPFVYGAGTAFSLQDPDELVTAMRAAGFHGVSCEQVEVPYRFDSLDQYIDNRIALSGPLWDGMQTASAATVAAVRQAIETALEPHRDDHGGYRLVNSAFCLAGRV